MKRAYKGSSVLVNGVEINVQQVLGRSSGDLKDRVARVARSAQGWLQVVIPEVKSAMDPKVLTAFNKCFRVGADPIAVTAVKSVLTTTQRGLMQPHGVKIRKDDQAYGYVRSYFSGPTDTSTNNRFHSGSTLIKRKGDIHVDVDTLKTDLTMSAITYIHEATHRFANTNDYDDQGYFKADGSDFEQPGITAFQALQNADSYAYFVLKTIEAKFKVVSI